MQKWHIKNPDLDQNNLVQSIYQTRGVDDYQALFSMNEKDLYDPYLLHDMDKSVKRIIHAIEENQDILIYGDYDVDGITSTFVLYETILKLGGKVTYDIPNRFIDGYGLSKAKVYDMINDEIDLLITVDNGIKSIEEVALLKKHKIDTIITDHHQAEETLPDAYSIIHTDLNDYPYKPLAGVGVAFKLAQALVGEDAFDYIDVVMLGTVADMMPLTSENRAIVNLGLKKARNSEHIGLSKLIQFLNLDQVSVADVQFKIAPRINACGRMKSAKIALNLLLSDDTKEANQIVEDIEEINNRRKKLTKVLYEEALDLYDETQNAIIIHSPRMHEGVLGIVASRLANDYGKVAVVLKEEDYTFKGSIRSYHGVDVLKILEKLSNLLERFGGHKNACGLEFKKEHLATFKRMFEELIPEAETDEVYEAEGIIDIETLDFEQISNLEHYDLKDALFVFEESKVLAKYLIKGEHTKLILSGNTDALFFNNKLLYQQVKANHSINLLGRLDINTFQNQTKKVIVIEDYQIL